MDTFAMTSFADKHIKCHVTTQLIARRAADQYLIHVDFSDPTMPAGYKEVDYDAEADEVIDFACIGGSFSTHGDHDQVAANWFEYWNYHDCLGTPVVAPRDNAALRTIHADIVHAYDDSEFTPSFYD